MSDIESPDDELGGEDYAGEHPEEEEVPETEPPDEDDE